MTDLDLTFVGQAVGRIGRRGEHCIPLLQAMQEHYRYLPQPALERLCELTDITPAQIAGVSTFYTQFRHSPVGKHMISVCHGTACHVKGSRLVQDALMRDLGIEEGADTTPDGLFTVQKVACLGCCTLAPVVQIDNVTYGHLAPDTVGRVLADFLELEKARAQAKPPRKSREGEAAGEIRVGLGSCCVAKGSNDLYEALQHAVAELGVMATIKRVGCVGMCHQTPMVEVVGADGQSHFYARVHTADAAAIVRRHFRPRSALRRIGQAAGRALENLLTDDAWAPVTRYSMDVRDGAVEAFLDPQRHLATEHCGHLDPLDLDEYTRFGGFEALKKCLGVCSPAVRRSSDAGQEHPHPPLRGTLSLQGRGSLSPQQIIKTITDSGLRGRGGAGFPTGHKW